MPIAFTWVSVNGCAKRFQSRMAPAFLVLEIMQFDGKSQCCQCFHFCINIYHPAIIGRGRRIETNDMDRISQG